jgi:hypothetical protein
MFLHLKYRYGVVEGTLTQFSCLEQILATLCSVPAWKLMPPRALGIQAAYRPLQCVSPGDSTHIYNHIYLSAESRELYNPLVNSSSVRFFARASDSSTRFSPSLPTDALVCQGCCFFAFKAAQRIVCGASTSKTKQTRASHAAPAAKTDRCNWYCARGVQKKRAQKYHQAVNRDQRSRLITASEGGCFASNSALRLSHVFAAIWFSTSHPRRSNRARRPALDGHAVSIWEDDSKVSRLVLFLVQI